ncbi:response regulator [Hwanghaeella sp.]|uniref:response regulator n=1 Tax=Hwanghaeella sp. TaxID=2605943 RepID=UPI003CCC1594
MAKQATFLIVEDDDVDRMALERAFDKLKILNDRVYARNGVEALDVLRGRNGKERLPRPFIILLDLNMPQMNGLEFLDEVRNDEDLANSVVFVLTTSDADEDIVAAYENNVAGYIVKSDAATGFLRAIEMLEHYWRVVELP